MGEEIQGILKNLLSPSSGHVADGRAERMAARRQSPCGGYINSARVLTKTPKFNINEEHILSLYVHARTDYSDRWDVHFKTTDSRSSNPHLPMTIPASLPTGRYINYAQATSDFDSPTATTRCDIAV